MGASQYNQGFRGGNQDRRERQGDRQRQGKAEITIADKPFSQWKSQIKGWVQNEIDKDTIRFSEDMGRILKEDGLTTSQIRNVFGEMRRIQLNGFEKEKSSFLLLKAKLAYATKRQQAKGMENFYELFCVVYDAVETSSDKSEVQFGKLLQIMEAVLAYHKYYGGK